MITADTINKLVELIANDTDYESVIRKFVKGYDVRNEFRQFIFLSILESKNPDKLIDIYNRGKFLFFFIRIVQNNIQSSTSTWHREYRIKEHMEQDIISNMEDLSLFDKKESKINKDYQEYLLSLVQFVQELCVKENPLLIRDFTLFNMYYFDEMTYRDLSKKTNIPKSSIGKYIKNAEFLIKQKLKI